MVARQEGYDARSHSCLVQVTWGSESCVRGSLELGLAGLSYRQPNLAEEVADAARTPLRCMSAERTRMLSSKTTVKHG